MGMETLQTRTHATEGEDPARRPSRPGPTGGQPDEDGRSALDGLTILFLPGIDGTGISFQPLARILRPGVKTEVVRYPPDRFLGFEETVRYTADSIGSGGGGVVVIAESFSGPVAVALLASGLLRAECLVLSATFARSPRPALLGLITRLPLEWILRLPLPQFLLKHVVEGGERPAAVFLDMWRRVKAIVPMSLLVHRLKIVNRVDVRPLLPKLTLPCLYIQASGDRSVPSSCLADFREGLSDLTVKRIRGPHFILQAEPEACLEAIEDFVASLGQRRRG